MPKPDLKRVSRKAFLRELEAFGEDQRALIAAQVSGFAIGAGASRDRRRRSHWDFRFFCETYFPHFVDESSPSAFQEHAYRLVPALMLKPGARVPIVAPRGEGKTTLLMQLHGLWRVANGYSRYIVLIMDAKEQAELMLEAMKAELEVNPRLAQDYPEVCGKGKLWRVTKVVTANAVLIEAFGAGKRIRGRRFGAHRPDLALISDLENDTLVKSKEQRDARENWLRKAVSNLGPPNGSMVQLYEGTLLHMDAVLTRTLKNPLWKEHAAVFPSIRRWPDRMDLWDRWEELLLNDGEALSETFYRQHRTEMEAGAEVSWPGVRPLLALMKLRTEDRKAFDTEHQHNPMDAEGHPFVGVLKFWVMVKREWLHFGAHDPSMGKTARRGDPSASLVGALDRETGKLHVIEALIARRTPEKQIQDVIRLQRDLKCLLWSIESVAFQEFFRTELVKASAKAGVPVPARGFMPSNDKDLRIESLQPHVANGLILFGRNQRTLIAQLEGWPDADHDDGPDALEMLWKTATSGLLSAQGAVRTGKRRDTVDLRGYQ